VHASADRIHRHSCGDRRSNGGGRGVADRSRPISRSPWPSAVKIARKLTEETLGAQWADGRGGATELLTDSGATTYNVGSSSAMAPKWGQTGTGKVPSSVRANLSYKASYKGFFSFSYKVSYKLTLSDRFSCKASYKACFFRVFL